jgi:phage regulator Rha-like protein
LLVNSGNKIAANQSRGASMVDLIPIERIESRIYLIRGQKVMLDRDLAELYGVETKKLNQAVKRNKVRFPDDFMFSLTRQEILRMSQIVTSSDEGKADLKYSKNVNVFTENGVAMLSSVLKSERAVLVNIQIMRAFTRLRRILSTHKEVSRKIKELEQRINKHDAEIRAIFEVIRKLMVPEKRSMGQIGFKQNK